MATIQDLIHNTLKINYSGTIGDMELAFYHDNQTDTIGHPLNEAKKMWLTENKGFTVGTVQDRDIAYMRSKGYTGCYSDMYRQILTDSMYFVL